MGYAKLDQRDLGIHFRQWSRAFIIADGSSTVVFISADVCMATQLMKMRVCRITYYCNFVLFMHVYVKSQ